MLAKKECNRVIYFNVKAKGFEGCFLAFLKCTHILFNKSFMIIVCVYVCLHPYIHMCMYVIRKR